MEPKKPTTFDEQISILKSKNILVDDEQACLDFLSKVNYYRFSAYFLPFKQSDGLCCDGVTFEQLKQIYDFDKNLRPLIFKVIDDIEISVKTQIAYYHSHKYGALGYMSPSAFGNKHDHIDFMNRVNGCIDENKKTLIVKHHKEKYDGQFPLWVIIEFFSIGMVSHFFTDLSTADQKNISKGLNNANYANMRSWMRCITDLRNKCAHYSRLYYSVFPAVPKIPTGISYKPTRRLFGQLFMLKLIYPYPEKWNSEFVLPLSDLIDRFSPFVDISHMDFPDNWRDILSF